MFLFTFFAAHFSFFMTYQKHWSPAFTGVREDNICVHLRSSVDMPFWTIHGCPDLAIQIRTMTSAVLAKLVRLIIDPNE